MIISDLLRPFSEFFKSTEIISLPDRNGWKVICEIKTAQLIIFSLTTSISITCALWVFLDYHKKKMEEYKDKSLVEADNQLPHFMSKYNEASSQLGSAQKKIEILNNSSQGLQLIAEQKRMALLDAQEKITELQESERLSQIQIDDLKIELDTERKNRFFLTKKEREELRKLIEEQKKINIEEKNTEIFDLSTDFSTGETRLNCRGRKIYLVREDELFRRCDQSLGAITSIGGSDLWMVFNGKKVALNLTEIASYSAATHDGQRYNCTIQPVRIREDLRVELIHSCEGN